VDNVVLPDGKCKYNRGSFEISPRYPLPGKYCAVTSEKQASKRDWQVAQEIVTEDRVKWAISPFKSAGLDRIFPALLQMGLDILLFLTLLFRACIALGYIPYQWCAS